MSKLAGWTKKVILLHDGVKLTLKQNNYLLDFYCEEVNYVFGYPDASIKCNIFLLILQQSNEAKHERKPQSVFVVGKSKCCVQMATACFHEYQGSNCICSPSLVLPVTECECDKGYTSYMHWSEAHNKHQHMSITCCAHAPGPQTPRCPKQWGSHPTHQQLYLHVLVQHTLSW